MKLKKYALYEGDNKICEGDIFQISRLTGLKVKTLRVYGSKTYEKKRKQNSKRLVVLEERGKQNKTYVLYTGETLTCIGTIKEIAENLGISETSVRFYATPTYHKRSRFLVEGKGRRLYCLD